MLDDFTIRSFVALAELRPESTILDICCDAIDQVAILAGDKLTDHDGSIVTVVTLEDTLPDGRRVLDYLGFQKVTQLHGDPARLDLIDGIYDQTSGRPHPTFDIIFAWHVLDSIPTKQHAATLRHWATFLTPNTGHIVFTVGVCDCGEIAGAVVLDKDGRLYQCFNMILDSEWAAGEQALGASVVAAGLRLRVTQRAGYGGEEALPWNDQANKLHEYAIFRHYQVAEEGHVDILWINADRTMSKYFKVDLKEEMVAALEQQLMEQGLHEPGADATRVIVPHMAVVAGVVSHGKAPDGANHWFRGLNRFRSRLYESLTLG